MSRRSKPTAADSWTDGKPIDFDTFVELYDVLAAHGKYEVRPALQIKHDDAAVVKTIDTLANAEETAANLRHLVMFEEPPFRELSDRQIALLAGHDFAADSRDEVPHEVPDATIPEPATDPTGGEPQGGPIPDEGDADE